MSNLFGVHTTYINKVTSLTPNEFGDKIDIFYGHMAAASHVVAVNVFSEENTEMTLALVIDVPEGSDPQEFVPEVIDPAIASAMSQASLRVQAKVAVPMDVLA
jgi:hypothetical protein